MIEAFKDWYPNEVMSGLQPPAMREVYSNSKFVLVGRGQSSLDCYRIYEGIICGALPVIVGNEGEVHGTFEFEGDFPPLVIASDYSTALNLCIGFSNDDIDLRRKELISWYNARIQLIMRRIDFVLQVFPP
jgi:hypothetical protein